MTTIFTRNKLNALSAISVSLLGLALLLSLQSCGGGGGSAVTPNLSIESVSISEGNNGTKNLDFTVTLSESTSNQITVAYTTSDVSATNGVDYQASSGTLTILANNTSGVISVPIIGDVVLEADETFNLVISNATNATITNDSLTVTGTINTDDLAGYYTGSATVNQGAGNLVVAEGSIRAIIDSTRLIIIDLTDDLIYIAPLNDFTGQAFSTTASVYKDGNFVRSTNISATFTAGASILVSLSGSGDYTVGAVSLAYSPKNSIAPLVFVDPDPWKNTPLTLSTPFTNNTTLTSITSTNLVASTALNDCDTGSVNLDNVISEQPGRIRSFAAITDTNCTNPLTDGTTLNGYITTIDVSGVDNRLLFIWFNSNGAYSSILDNL